MNAASNHHSNKKTIIKTATGKHLKETLPMLMRVVDHMRFQRGVTLSELVGDFIKDEEGNWWLVNVKAFRMDAACGYGIQHRPKQRCQDLNDK